jgi:hypothetical protein
MCYYSHVVGERGLGTEINMPEVEIIKSPMPQQGPSSRRDLIGRGRYLVESAQARGPAQDAASFAARKRKPPPRQDILELEQEEDPDFLTVVAASLEAPTARARGAGDKRKSPPRQKGTSCTPSEDNTNIVGQQNILELEQEEDPDFLTAVAASLKTQAEEEVIKHAGECRCQQASKSDVVCTDGAADEEIMETVCAQSLQTLADEQARASPARKRIKQCN